MQQERKGMGPFQTLGVAFSTVATTAVVLNDVVKSGGGVITGSLQSADKIVTAGNDALDIALGGMLEDLRCDNLVESAYRKVRLAEANAEVDRILAGLPKPVDS